MENKTLFDDEKKFRKLRKVLRQIEHLKILTRELNEEEKDKVSKQKTYKNQLKELNLKYPNNELSFRDNQQNYNNTSAIELEQSSSQCDEEKEVLNTSEIKVEVKKQSISSINEPDVQIDDLTSKLNSLNIEKEIKAEKVVVSAPNIPEPAKIVKEQKQTKNSQKQQELKSIVNFETFEIKDAHDDLIVSLDVYSESELIVTGSRNTSIKVWCYKNLKDIKLIHSFGGHSGPVTQVKFWNMDYYEQSLNNLALQTGEEPELINEADSDIRYPLIISSSLDCSLRIWNISKGRCIQEFYLYNPVNHFEIDKTCIFVGLGAGKIIYLNNLTQINTLKAFDDIDSVCCVKLFNDNKLYVLTVTGIMKIFEISSTCLTPIREANIYSFLSKDYLLKKNFKSFEIVSESKVLIVNDTQSFLILYDMSQNTCEFISTNTNTYGFTSSFFKLENSYFVSAYNIDDESSNINVFECNLNNASFNYKYTVQDLDLGSSLTALKCVQNLATNCFLIFGCSRETMKIWRINEISNDLFVKSSNRIQVKYLKMCKKFNFHAESCNEEEEDEEDDDDEEKNKSIKSKEEPVSKNYCLIQ